MKIAQFENYTTTSYTSYDTTPSLKSEVELIFTRVGIVSGTLSAIMLAIIVYTLLRIKALDEEESAMKKALIKKHYFDAEKEAKNPRWELVEEMVQSQVLSDWKLAIIEADVLLEEALKNYGFTGESVGEMLTIANPKSFATYNQAWEAHKVRNEIAHQGSTFKLTKDDTIRTINMYRLVLQEFSVI